MSITRKLGWVASLVTLVLPSMLPAMTPATIGQAKKATALVEMEMDVRGKAKAYGSAFCIDASGVFVTNAHVTEHAQNGAVTLIVEPGEKSQRVLSAKVLRTDMALDLALVQATGMGEFESLPLGKADALFETMGVTAFGYPFGEALASSKKEYPSISVNTGKISSLRKAGGELQLIQIDAAVNPGNSGGPILDDTGSVVGIVQMGVVGTGVNFAIPVTSLSKLLAKPLAIVSPTTLPYEKRNVEQPFTVHVISAQSPKPSYAVELTMRVGERGTDQKVSGATTNGVCTLRVRPVASAMAEEAVSSVEYQLVVRLKDQPDCQTNGWIRFAGAPSGAIAFGTAGELWSYIHAEVEAKHPKATSLYGGGFNTRDPFEDLPEDGAVLIGFNCTLGKFIDNQTIDSLQPIYLTPTGEKVGAVWGEVKSQKVTLRAKEGYVVTGMEIRTGGAIDGLGLVYARFERGAIVGNDRYKSEWLGNNSGGSLSQFSTDGKLAVGICGKKEDGKLGSIGLLLLPIPANLAARGAVLVKGQGGATTVPTTAPLAAGTKEHENSARNLLPSRGKPFVSLTQMLEVLPIELMPLAGKWQADDATSSELTDRLKGKTAHVSADFGSSREVESGGTKTIEVLLDCGFLESHGVRFIGKIVARFPMEQAKKIEEWQIHDKIVLDAIIDHAVAKDSAIATVTLWLRDAKESK